MTGVSARIGAKALHTRWFVRAPIRLYRAGLGFLFGPRLLMLEHTGRRSGLARHVVLEVVEHPDPGTWIVVSGFGAKAQWYRNIQANPAVRLWCGTHRHTPATATTLSTDQSAAVLDRYATAHPRAWATLRTTIEHAAGAAVDTLPMVGLHRNRHAPPTK